MATAQDHGTSTPVNRIAGVALMMGALVAPAVAIDPASAAPAAGAPLIAQVPDSCPAAFPTRRLVAGQDVHGLTVEKGIAPDDFTGKIVGVIEDGIAPGLDMIIAELDSAAIRRVDGIWAGMSGSPVYAEDDRLIGAVAYGLSFGPSPIAGITPASAMYDLLDGGTPTTAAARQVDLPGRLERRLVGSGAATTAQAAGGLEPLPIPVGVSGLAPGRLRPARRRFAEHIDNARFYHAAAASGRAAAVAPVAGGNVAVALAFGDATFGGVGTVTAVCDGQALLFGHPATFAGATTLSAHEATAVYVQRESLGAPFKVANFGGAVGTVDQDRLAGLHTELGAGPPTARIRSNFTARDSGRSRIGTTRVALQDFMADATFGHALVNLDRVADRIGGGVVEYVWSASGTREDRSPWRLRRREVFADRFDATFFAAFPPADMLFQIQDNQFEDVTVDSVQLNGSVSPVYRAARIVGLEMRGGRGQWRAVNRRSPIRMVAGEPTEFRAVLMPFRSERRPRVEFSLTAPARLSRAAGQLAVTGGGFSFFDGEELAGEAAATGLDRLLENLRSQPSGDEITARLVLTRRRPTPARAVRQTTARATTVVEGGLEFEVRVVAAP